MENEKPYKMIVFDGDFHEKEINWITAPTAEECRDLSTWQERIGFRSQLWTTGEQDIGPRYLVVSQHHEREAWLVGVRDVDRCFDVLIEGAVNYLRFLNSPICTDITLYEHIEALRMTCQAAFRAWHSHEPPSFPEDQHRLGYSCNQCDPGGAPFRDAERKERSDTRARNRKRELHGR